MLVMINEGLDSINHPFRHFVNLPSLTKEEKRSLRVLCVRADQLLVSSPSALNEDYVLVETEGSALFMVNDPKLYNTVTVYRVPPVGV